jgi:sugar phosphate isomerase/epimerase
LSKDQPGLKTGESLAPEKRREMKQRMDDLGISMPTYYAPIEGDKGAWRKIFDFAKEMGVQTLVAEPPPEALAALEPLCQEYKISLAMHNHPEGSGSKYWNPDTLVKACEGLSPRIGACPDTGHWVRSGLDTLESLKKYGKRIITIHLKDAETSGKRDSRDVPLGTGMGNYTALLKQLHDWKWRGVMSVEYEHLSPQLVQDVAQCVKFVEDFAAGVKK